MSSPRPQCLSETLHIQFRCIFQWFLLRPDETVGGVIGYWLTTAMNRYNIAVHLFFFMSNHGHLVVTDEGYCEPTPEELAQVVLDRATGEYFSEEEAAEIARGDLKREEAMTGSRTPALTLAMKCFKSNVARALNYELKRRGTMWGPAGTDRGRQTLTTYAAGVEKSAYVLCQAVDAGIVADSRAWPGLATLLPELGATVETCGLRRFRRPAYNRSVSRGGHLPDEVVLQLQPNPLGAADPEGFVRDVRTAVERRVAAKRAEMKRAGKSFAGVGWVRRLDRYTAPARDWDKEQAELQPHFADPDPEVRRYLARAYRRWQAWYGAAMERWMTKGEAEFPPGTNQMRGKPGVTVREGPWY